MIRTLAAVLVSVPLGVPRRGLGSAQVCDLVCTRKAMGCLEKTELRCSL